MPLRVSTISPTALGTWSFRTGAAGNQTPARPSAAAEQPPGAAPAAAGEQQQPQPQQRGAALSAQDVVAAVVYCLSAPEGVDLAHVRLRPALV